MSNIDELIEKLPTGYAEGPWHIVPYGDGDSLVIHHSDEERVCFMATPGSPYAMMHIEANAHLIALAPEMAAALSTLQEQKRKLEEALRESHSVLSQIPAPHSWPLWTRMCAALKSSEALLSGGGE